MSNRPVLLVTVVLTVVSFFCSVRSVQAQDPEFSQFYANPLYLNPAFTGTNGCGRLVMNYRNQWPSLAGNYETIHASYDQYVNGLNGGAGVSLYQDNAGRGVLRTTMISGYYAYQTPISRKWTVSFGAQVSYHQRSLNWDDLTFPDQIDPRRGFIYETRDTQRGGRVANADFSAGGLIYNETFYGGIAVHHLAEPNESLIVGTSRLPRKYTVHAGAVIPIGVDVTGNSETSLSPNIMYQRQGEFVQYNAGVYANIGPLVVGTWYRFSLNKGDFFSDSIILSLGMQTEQIRVGYSYDLTVSGITADAGSHEVSAAFLFSCKPNKKKFRAINCPTF